MAQNRIGDNLENISEGISSEQFQRVSKVLGYGDAFIPNIQVSTELPDEELYLSMSGLAERVDFDGLDQNFDQLVISLLILAIAERELNDDEIINAFETLRNELKDQSKRREFFDNFYAQRSDNSINFVLYSSASADGIYQQPAA